LDKSDASSKLTKKVLKDRYLELNIDELKVKEELEGPCYITAVLNNGRAINGSGIGLVSALMEALKSEYSKDYNILQKIKLGNFSVKISPNTGNTASRTDAYCHVSLILKNSIGAANEFQASSRSLMAATARAVCLGVSHFINAASAHSALEAALEDAKERGRDDLVTRFTRELSDLVKNSSFER
jgi:hypothetical protein